MNTNDHVQALGKAMSDLLNSGGKFEHPCHLAASVAWAWETAGLADACDKCDGMVWPSHVFVESDKYVYTCPACDHTWTCYYTPAWRNDPNTLAECILSRAAQPQ